MAELDRNGWPARVLYTA